MQFLLILASLLASADVSAEQQYHRDLAELATKCDELNLDEQAQITRKWTSTHRADQIDLYIPVPESATIPDDSSQLVKFWHERFLEIRTQYADSLFILLLSDGTPRPESTPDSTGDDATTESLPGSGSPGPATPPGEN